LGQAPFKYSVNGGAANLEYFTGLAAGTYNVTVQDAKVVPIQIVLLLRVNHQWSLIEQ
jgi:hypothetical protein